MISKLASSYSWLLAIPHLLLAILYKLNFICLVVSIVRLHLHKIGGHTMFWTLELASHLEDAPWPATKDELIDYAIRSGAPLEVVENLQELEDDGEIYESLEDIWPDYPSQDDFFFNEDEY